jgi:thiamine-phosphate pyrophosphorylase
LPRLFKLKGIYRVLDANINRAKEGLRVCEEIVRFIVNDRHLTSRLKGLRHQIDAISRGLSRRSNLLAERESEKDVGRSIYQKKEFKRNNYQDIFSANIQRVKEAIRVLEEFSKLENTQVALKFMKIRYDIYGLEKKIIKRITSLCHHR